MKITMSTTHQGPHSRAITVATQGDDQDINDVGEMLRSLLLAWSFAPESVNALFGGEE